MCDTSLLINIGSQNMIMTLFNRNDVNWIYIWDGFHSKGITIFLQKNETPMYYGFTFTWSSFICYFLNVRSIKQIQLDNLFDYLNSIHLCIQIFHIQMYWFDILNWFYEYIEDWIRLTAVVLCKASSEWYIFDV